MSAPDDPLARLAGERIAVVSVRAGFHAALDDLGSRLADAAESVAESVVPVTAALLTDDERRLPAWWDRQDALRVTCRRIEDDGFGLLARESPVAGDLRQVVAIVRSSGHVHRSVELLGHVARSSRWMDPTRLAPGLQALVHEIAEVSSKVFEGAADAWREADSLRAVDLDQADDAVDELQRRLHDALVDGGCSTGEAVSLALIARYLERIADHGVALAREQTYAMTGERLDDS